MKSTYHLLLICFSILVLSCNENTDDIFFEESQISQNTLFEPVSNDISNITFENTITEDENFHHLNWESVYNGGGVATADFDNDGLLDIYFTGNQVDDAIYKNLGDWNFEDKTASSGIQSLSGWSSGVAIADVNQDGLLDIYVCRMWHAKDGIEDEKRKNLLWINKGNFKFEESASEYGIDNNGHSTQASFFDYDRDGDLDLFIINSPSNNYGQKLKYINDNKIPEVHWDCLYRNDGSTFTDVTTNAGLVDFGYSLGLVTIDINNDGWTDIYVANDFDRADRMFINQKDGTFKDEIQRYLKHISYSSMGTDIADINNDHFNDIAVLDMSSFDHYRSKTNMPSMDINQFWTNVARGQHFQYMSNMLQLNNGNAFFSEIAHLAGIASSDWSWAILLADFDLDSYNDIYITNGINKDIRNNDFSEKMKIKRLKSAKELYEFAITAPSQPIQNRVYKNLRNLNFSLENKTWGAADAGYSYGASYADMDNDGDLDLVVNNNNALASLYNNNSSGNFINFKILKNNTALLNAKVMIYYGENSQAKEITTTRGYQSSVTSTLHFGLGKYNSIDSFKVILPTGEKYIGTNNKANQLVTINTENNNLEKTKQYFQKPDLVFNDITKISGLNYRHTENKYNDFAKEVLLPHKQSTQGPYVATADINNDGYEDVYIGNSHDSPGALYLGGSKQFILSNQQAFINDNKYEDQGAAFFDANGDGALDLYVVSGGSEKEAGNKIYQDRLYINKNGVFTKTELPEHFSNGSNILIHDFNGDKELDVFVGARGIPGKYPKADKAQLLINHGGKFSNEMEQIAPYLSNIGMITDALILDINGDNIQDLIVVGEFMRPEIFINHDDVWHKETEKYIPEHMNGWWYSIEKVDMDNDGIPEILLGNIGTNNKYHPSSKKPLRIYGNDFDHNNTSDIVLTKETDKYGEVPVRGRECSSEQMPFIKSKFDNFKDFASADIQKIIGEKDLENAIQLYADNFDSGYLKKNGDSYEFIAFQPLAQISAIRDFEVYDYDKDGDMDIIIVGNMFNAEVETVRHDASIGLVLKNNNGQLVAQNRASTGWYTPGNARQVKKIHLREKDYFLVSNNGFVLQCIEVLE